MHRMIISAPFGNWISFPNATSTLGTYTWPNRGGLAYRAWRMALTMRYDAEKDSWTNKLGLPNPGIIALQPSISHQDKILSIFGFNKEEWDKLALQAYNIIKPLAVEFNLSCPNVKHTVLLDDITCAVEYLISGNIMVIAKLPPLEYLGLAVPLYGMGVRVFHCCNTLPSLPTDRWQGGKSGKVLKPYSLAASRVLRDLYGDSITLIGGGGVKCRRDVADYIDAGVDHVAMASALLNPFKWYRYKKLARIVDGMFMASKAQYCGV